MRLLGGTVDPLERPEAGLIDSPCAADTGGMHRALFVLALVALTATVSATAALGGARSVACQTRPAKTFSARDTHSLEFLGHGFTLDSFADARHHSLKVTGPDRYVGQVPPGWNENSVINGGPVGTDLVFDPGHPNAYAAGGHTGGGFPTELMIRRYTSGIQLDGIAAWVVMNEPPSNFTLAYANGQSLSSLRLCLDRGRNGSIDAAFAPTGFVEGPAANDTMPPRISVRLLATTSDTATAEIVATDSGSPAASGVGAIWVENGPDRSRYTTPIRVRRDAKLIVWAMDRAGNLASSNIDVATLVTP
jgi:hypothetical protein